MDSVIRVRGKRGNKRTITDQGKKTRKATKRHHSAPYDGPAVQPGLSKLEQLPTELLERICIHSGNINLVRSSPLLFSCLASEHVKFGLMERVFASKDDHQIHGNGKILHASQQALLRTRWLDYPFLMQCKERFLHEFAERQFARAVGPDKAKDGVEQMRRTLAPAFAETAKVPFTECRKTNRQTVYDRLSRKSDLIYAVSTEKADSLPKLPWFYHPRLEDSFSFSRPPPYSIPFAAQLSNGSHIRVAVKNPEFHQLPPDCSGVQSLLQMPWSNHHCEFPLLEKVLFMPSGLLHGPWTKDKFNLLAFLTIESVGVREVDKPLLKQGLSDAIREICIPAIVCLTYHPGNNGDFKDKMQLWKSATVPAKSRGKTSSQEGSSTEWIWIDGLKRVDKQRYFVDVGLDHFELLFDRAADFGKDFFLLFQIMTTAALWAYSCTREELIDRALEAKSGKKVASWAAGFFGKDAIELIDEVWNKAEHFRYRVKEVKTQE